MSYYAMLKSGEIEEVVIVSENSNYNSAIFWMRDGVLLSFGIHFGVIERSDLTGEAFDEHITNMINEGAFVYGRGRK